MQVCGEQFVEVPVGVSPAVVQAARGGQFFEIAVEYQCCECLTLAVKPDCDVGGPYVAPNAMRCTIVSCVFKNVSVVLHLPCGSILRVRSSPKQSLYRGLSKAFTELNGFVFDSVRIDHSLERKTLSAAQ